MLNLDNVLNYEGNKNLSVLAINKEDILIKRSGGSKATFENVYGSLCGGENEGVVIDESLDMLFVVSNMYVMHMSETSVLVQQNKKKYSIDICTGTEGCSLPDKHVNFNSICLVEDENNKQKDGNM